MEFERGNFTSFQSPQAEAFTPAPITHENYALSARELPSLGERALGVGVTLMGLYFMYQGGKSLYEGNFLSGMALVLIGGILTSKGKDMTFGNK